MSESYYNVLIPVYNGQESYTYKSSLDLKPGQRVIVPVRNQKKSGIVYQKLDEKPDLSIPFKEIESLVDASPVFNEEQWQLARTLAHNNLVSLAEMLPAMLPAQLKPFKKKTTMQKAVIYLKEETDQKLSARQQALYEKLPGEISASELELLETKAVISALVKKGALRKEERLSDFSWKPETIQREQKEWLPLTREQQQALSELRQSQSISLLYGVTGSGKTELFFHLIQDALDQNGQALILVPEIGLTPKMAQRIAERFRQPVVIYHGSLKPAQSQAIYHGVQNSEIPIVIGTRSAAFLPFSNLKLIVMDEEHDASYQSSSSPYFHTKDVLFQRAQTHQAKVVLASATPSLESYARAHKGLYQLVRLDQRVNEQKNRLHLVDLALHPQYQTISLPLIEAIEKRLKRNEQVILLLNRRGYLPVYQCGSCHHTMVCDECGIALSYHKGEDQLVCHICGKRFQRPQTCPECGGSEFSQTGLGTERLSETLQELFPSARIIRMDADTTRKRDAHEHLLNEFEREGDILLGTQMVAKGHDFGRVTLVGILNADQLLLRPDFRCNEMTYQLLEQAAGRAGRAELSGEVIIQSYNPDHYVLQMLEHKSFPDFFRREMKYRHIGNHPPYQHMAMLIFTDKDFETTSKMAVKAREYFSRSLVETLGPIEISMRQKNRRMRLLLRDKDYGHLIETLWKFQDWAREQFHGSIQFHINPMRLEE